MLWTRLGSGPFGAYLASTLERYGIPERFVVRDDDAMTALAFVARDDSGPSFTFYREGTADTRFERGTVPDDVLDDLSWVAFGGVCLSTEPARTAMLDLASGARERGCEVFFDPNARPELWDGGFDEALADACERATVVKATPEDLAVADIEGSPDALLEAILDLGPHTAVLTLGGEGAVGTATADAPWGPATASHDGYAVETVDTTGAGDAFAAGLLRSLADGDSLEDALSFANGTAAIATTKEGAMSASVDRESVERLRE